MIKSLLEKIDTCKHGVYLDGMRRKVEIYAGEKGWFITCDNKKSNIHMDIDNTHINYEKAEEFAFSHYGKLTVISIDTMDRPKEITIGNKYGFRIKKNKITGVLVNGTWIDDCKISISKNDSVINFNEVTKGFDKARN
jgi:hypothetical protein